MQKPSVFAQNPHGQSSSAAVHWAANSWTGLSTHTLNPSSLPSLPKGNHYQGFQPAASGWKYVHKIDPDSMHSCVWLLSFNIMFLNFNQVCTTFYASIDPWIFGTVCKQCSSNLLVYCLVYVHPLLVFSTWSELLGHKVVHVHSFQAGNSIKYLINKGVGLAPNKAR